VVGKLLLNYFEKYSKTSKKWFGNEGVYVNGDEKLFTLYLELFRFRIGENSEGNTVFNVSVRQLYTHFNKGRNIISLGEVTDFLIQLSKMKIIKLLSYKSWNTLLKHDGHVNYSLLLEDISVDDEEGYNYTPLDIIDYIFSQSTKYTKHVIFYMFMKNTINIKTNKDHKCWMSVNKMADKLQFGDKTVAKCISDLNKIGVIASHKLDNMKGGTKFEHYLLKDMGQFEEFNKVHRAAMNKFK
jgi:hypothetical protein